MLDGSERQRKHLSKLYDSCIGTEKGVKAGSGEPAVMTKNNKRVN